MAQRIIILGAGRFGSHLAARLSEFGCEVVLADRNGGRVRELAEDGFDTLQLDAEDEDALREAGVQEADAVVVSIGENLQGSVLATLALKELNVKRVICRALDAKHAQVLAKVGADEVVLPSRDMAYRLAERLYAGMLGDRMPISGDYQLASVRLGSRLHGQTLRVAALPQDFKVTVVLVSRVDDRGKPHDIEPSADFVLAQRDLLFVTGRRAHINRFERECGELSAIS
jgi:trk system potassium uptake protein TrkA